jgi:lipoprotein-releasing system permease protein
LFLSLRYLRPKRTFVSVITVISVLGVTLGVWILTTVIAVITGFNIQMRERVLGSQPHLTAQLPRSAPIQDWPALLRDLRAFPGVRDLAPFVEGQAVLDFQNRVWVVRVLGVDPRPGPLADKLAALIPPAEDYRDFGRPDLSDDHALIGRYLADSMGIPLGDSLILHSVANGREILDANQQGREPESLILPAELTVTGVFQSDDEETDSALVYVPLEVAQALFENPGTINGVDLELDQPYHAERVRAVLARRFPEYEWISWIGRNAAEFNAVAQERMNMYFLLFMIMVVAGFCITNTMITVTTQKRQEIGLMKAVGALRHQIVGAFLWQGILVGWTGTVSGLLLAFATLLARQNLIRGVGWIFGMNPHDPGLSFLWNLPAKITALDLCVISGGAFLACAVSALLPAHLAAALDPAHALRNQTPG